MSIPLFLILFYLCYADNHPSTPSKILPPRHAYSRSEDYHHILHSTEVGRRPPFYSSYNQSFHLCFPILILLLFIPTSLSQDLNTEDMNTEDQNTQDPARSRTLHWYLHQSTSERMSDTNTFSYSCKIWPTHFQDSSYSHPSEYSPPSDINLLPTLFQIFPTTLSVEDIFMTHISIPPEKSATLYLPHYCSSAQDIRFKESHQVSRLYHQEEEDPKVIKNDKDADRRQVAISNQIS